MWLLENLNVLMWIIIDFYCTPHTRLFTSLEIYMFFFTNLCPVPKIVPEYLLNERKGGREGDREGGRETGKGRKDREWEEDKESIFTLMKFTRLGMIQHI